MKMGSFESVYKRLWRYASTSRIESLLLRRHCLCAMAGSCVMSKQSNKRAKKPGSETEQEQFVVTYERQITEKSASYR